MKVKKIISNEVTIDGPLLLEPKIFADSRGFFMESWNQKKFNEIVGKTLIFVQDNFSNSVKGVIRGLHYQKKPYEQGKIVRCIKGEIYDVIVDLRKESSTFSKWYGINLSSENHYQLWIPEGFAHGFLAISSTAEISYKTTSYWHPKSETTIMWDDKEIGIKWPLLENNIIKAKLSEKDEKGITFADFQNNNSLK